MAQKRLNMELLGKIPGPKLDGSAGVKAVVSSEGTGDDIFHWQGEILGPEGTPYEGGVYRVNVLFPSDYPFHPPSIQFLSNMLHINVSETGVPCLGILKV